MEKKRFLLLLFLLFTIGATAEPCVVVNTSSGETVFFFSVKPKFTYDGQTVKLSTSNTQIEYSPSNILSVKIDDRTNTGINSVSNEGKNISYSISDNAILIHGCKPNETVSVYSINGIQIARTVVDEIGDANISINNFQNGVYIIKSKRSSIKIVKR